MRGGSTSFRKTSAPPSKNTPTSQAALTAAEPMIQRDWRALATGKARIPTYKPSQVSVEDAAWKMVTMRMSDMDAPFAESGRDLLLRSWSHQRPQRHQGSDGNVLVIHQVFLRERQRFH